MIVNLQLNKEDYKHEMGNAIGHLISWGISHYHTLDILLDMCDTDYNMSIIGVFRNEDGTHGYTIGAIWDGSRYTYHS